MSLFLLDEQLDIPRVLPRIQRWATARRLQELRPREQILDDRVPQILLTLKQPTFLTIDKGFWDRRWCHPGYCILQFALDDDQQELLPDLLHALLQRGEFRTRANRMGKLARVGLTAIEYWEFPPSRLQRIAWQGLRRRRR